LPLSAFSGNAPRKPCACDSGELVVPPSSGAQLLSVGENSGSVPKALGADDGLGRWPFSAALSPPAKSWRDSLATRLAAMRLWLRTRLRGATSGSPSERDFSHEVYTTMNGCLGCRTCASDCPLKLQVPDLKPQFLALYHRRHPHSVRDHLVARFEALAAWLGWMPRLSNLVLRARSYRWAMRSLLGIVNPPLLSEQTLRHGLRQRKARLLRPTALGELGPQEQRPGVLIVQDVFTTFFEPDVVLACYDLLRELGYGVHVLPFHPNGNALQIKGFIERFRRTSERNALFLGEAAALGVPLVGIDPAVTLTYRAEYGDSGSHAARFKVLLVQEWLVQEQARIRQHLEQRGCRPTASRSFRLLVHCSERDATASGDLWQRAFGIFGLELDFFGSGCCRVGGTSACQVSDSAGTRWQKVLPEDPELRRCYLATGYSCRRQVAGFAGRPLRHPAEVLLETTRAHCAGHNPTTDRPGPARSQSNNG
jgi:Fe-S oxidoreductase